MTISAVTAEQVSSRVVEHLGLDPLVHDAFTPEAMASSLRRAASFLCPATPAEIIDAVRDVLAPLDAGGSLSRDDLASMLDLMIANGDLLELRQSGQRATRLIYLGPPSFVTKVPGDYLLLGVRPEGRPLLDEETAEGLQYEGHLRSLALAAEVGPALLRAAGLQELRANRWLRHPRAQAASDLLAAYRVRLDAALQAGSVEGLEVLDPAKPIHYYRGRWRPVDAADTGDFVGRRPQAYGAAAWCFVRVVGGQPARIVDLPVEDASALARDEAWRVQAAIDAERGVPQQYGLRQIPGQATASILDLFGPMPSWAARQLDLVGLPVARSQGALFSYRLGEVAIGAATRLLTDMLWMQPRNEGGSA